MIAAISLMRRRPDISVEQFRRHWLHPHGTMTAELLGLRYYVQHHPIDAPGTNALARELTIDGIPELWFDDYDARRIAYTSPRMAECNVDSENFVGSVSRLVTEPDVVIRAPKDAEVARLLLLTPGGANPTWAERVRDSIVGPEGVVGYVAHRVIEQAAAPNSRIPELKLAIGGVAQATFATEAALADAMTIFAATPESVSTAVYRVEDHQLR